MSTFQTPWQAAEQKFLEDSHDDDRALFRSWLKDNRSAEKLEDEIRVLEAKHTSLAKMKPWIEGLKGLDSIVSPLTSLDAHGAATLIWGSAKVIVTFALKEVEFREAITEALVTLGYELSLFREYEPLYSRHGTTRFNASLERLYSSYLYFCSSTKTFYRSSGWRRFKEASGISRKKHSSGVELAMAEVKAACARAKSEVDLVDKQTQAAANKNLEDGMIGVSSGIKDVQLRMDKLNRQLAQVQGHADVKGQEQYAAISANKATVDRLSGNVEDVHVRVANLRQELHQSHSTIQAMLAAQATLSDDTIHAIDDMTDDLQSMKLDTDRLANELAASRDENTNGINDLKSIGNEIAAGQDQVNEKLDKVDLKDFAKWLQHIDMEKYLDENLEKRSALPQTCNWALADDKISRWACSAPDSVQKLWLTADAGFGKSVLTSYIISEMRKLYPTGVAHFFCRHDEHHALVQILRSWIWQLTSIQRIGGKVVGSHLAIVPDAVVDYNNASEPTLGAMCDLMRVLYQQSKPTLLVLDGLDECDILTEKTKRDWASFFEILGQLPANWKLLIVSRPNNGFNALLKQKLGSDLVAKYLTKVDNEEDVHDFAELEVSTDAEETVWTEQLKKDIFTLMLDKADGNMQWVKLLSETIRYGDEETVRSLLDKPPENLGQLYGRVLDNLVASNKKLGEKVRMALKWILCAYRPLKTKELAAIVSIPLAAMEDNIIKYIGPMIKVDGEYGTIRLQHASARDYLISPDANLFDGDTIQVAERLAFVHAMLLETCLRHLSAKERTYVFVGPGQDPSVRRVRVHVADDDLLEYSCNGWVQHFVEAFKFPHVLERAKSTLQRFGSDDAAVVKWLQIFHFLWNNDAPSDTARGQIGAWTYRPRGTNDWADYLSEMIPELVRHLSWEDGGKYTRWDRFMYRQHTHRLEHPARLHEVPRVLPQAHVAAFFDYDKEVQRSLENGVPVDDWSPLRSTALHWAAAGGSCRSISALLHAGANINAPTNRHNETPIFKAIRCPEGVPLRIGTYPAARMLFDAGAKLEHEPRSNGFHVSTALIALVETGPDSQDAASFALTLCSRDPAANGDYMHHGTISQVAAWYNRQLILEKLLTTEVQRKWINRQDPGTRFRAVLHDACTQDNPYTTKILLSSGANINLQCDLNGFTPLHFAVLAGPKVVEVLLSHEKTADPCIRDQGGHMPIHLAARYGIETNYSMFVGRGFPIDQMDGNGDTSLTIALESGHFDVAKTLLKLGADPSKVRRNIKIFLPIDEKNEQLTELRGSGRAGRWQPIASYDYLHIFRQLSKHKIPIPIVDYILRLAGHHDQLHASRKGTMRVNEHITDRIPYPYLTTPPIIGNAMAPVRKIECFVRSSDQGHSNPGGDYSLSQLCIVGLDGKMRPWQGAGEGKFARTSHQMRNHRHTVSKKDKPKRIGSLLPGERVGVFPWAWCPGFENVTDEASISLHQVTLRSHYTRSEKIEIWGKHLNRQRPGRDCDKRKCRRCAAEKFLKERAKVEIEIGAAKLDVSEIMGFLRELELLKDDSSQ